MHFLQMSLIFFGPQSFLLVFDDLNKETNKVYDLKCTSMKATTGAAMQQCSIAVDAPRFFLMKKNVRFDIQ